MESSGRTEALAINLFDLDRLEPLIRGIISKHLDPRALRIGERDEVAVAFTCPLLQAACLCDLIRSENRRFGDYPARAYLRKEEGKAWRELPGDAILAEVIDHAGKQVCRLHPSVFPLPERFVPIPPEAKPCH